MTDFSDLCKTSRSLGAFRAVIIPTNLIETDSAFRDICASNGCGMYGKNYMCPPDVGDINSLIKQLFDYELTLVYQTVSDLADPYDIEGMMEAKQNFTRVAQGIRKMFCDKEIKKVLQLGAGGCNLCEICGKLTDEPCRHPELAIPSMEAYGVNVSKLAATCGMNYINGQNTVTYFGAVLFENIVP